MLGGGPPEQTEDDERSSSSSWDDSDESLFGSDEADEEEGGYPSLDGDDHHHQQRLSFSYYLWGGGGNGAAKQSQTTSSEKKSSSSDDSTIFTKGGGLLFPRRASSLFIESALDQHHRGSSSAHTLLPSNIAFSSRTLRTCKVVSHAVPIVASYFRCAQRLKALKKECGDDVRKYRKLRDAELDRKHDEMASKIAAMYDDLGGVFLKAAQYAVAQGRLLPSAWERALRFAFRNARKRPWAEIAPILKAEGIRIVGCTATHTTANGDGTFLGGGRRHQKHKEDQGGGRKKAQNALAKVDETPLAAASVGQVHRATLAEPFVVVVEEEDALSMMSSFREVAVKVLYNDARKNMAQDLANQRTLCLKVNEVLELNAEDALRVVLDEFDRSFPRELDLRLEVANALKARALFSKLGFADVLVPRPVLDLCSPSVLVSQFVHGETLADMFRLSNADSAGGGAEDTAAAPYRGGVGGALVVADPHTECGNDAKDPVLRALLRVVDAVGASLFLEGFFHADCHPGNVMMRPDVGPSDDDDARSDDHHSARFAPALVDWGQCCELDADSVETLARLALLLNARSRTLLDLVLTKEDDSKSHAKEAGKTDFCPLRAALAAARAAVADRFDFAASSRTGEEEEEAATASVDERAALLYLFFDSATPDFANPAARRVAYLLQHDAARCPALTRVPREVIFFGRTVGALKKCLELVAGGDTQISVLARWAPYARQALKKKHHCDNRCDERKSTTGPRYLNNVALLDAALLALPVDPRWTARLEPWVVRAAASPTLRAAAATALVASAASRTASGRSGNNRKRTKRATTTTRTGAALGLVARAAQSDLLHLALFPALDRWAARARAVARFFRFLADITGRTWRHACVSQRAGIVVPVLRALAAVAGILLVACFLGAFFFFLLPRWEVSIYSSF